MYQYFITFSEEKQISYFLTKMSLWSHLIEKVNKGQNLKWDLEFALNKNTYNYW